MDPVIDPATGKPVEPNNNNTPPTVAVPAEEWGAMKARLDVFEKGGYNNQQTNTPPPAPSGPSTADQIKEIETQIDALDVEIDTKVTEGKPVSALMKKRSALDRQITRIQIKAEDIDPMMNAGMLTIDALSSEVSKGKMKYFDIVKNDYESLINSIDPAQRSSLEVKQKIYDIAVGQNIDKIMAAQQEELLRQGHDNANNPPPNNNGRNNDGDDNTPKVSDILSRDALNAIKSRGMTVDEYYKKRGFKDGWKGYFEKHKSYYQDKGLVE